jgi:hypothetical protein
MKPSLTRVGFLLTCFLFPGLIGTFASFSIPAPVVDELHQEAALQAVLTAAPAARAGLIAQLPNDVDDDTAALVAHCATPLPACIADAEAHMRQEVLAQARASAYRIRLMVITMTVLAAMLGVALLGGERAPR